MTACHAVVFPFDLFGSGGCAAGAQLLKDLLSEIVDDAREEAKPIRQKKLIQALTIEEIEFNDISTLQRWQALGNAALKTSLDHADFTLWLSGNHLGCLPIYQCDSDLLIVQFDAHLDCYDLHDTHQTLSHGNFVREAKRPVVNVGHRDLFLDPGTIREYFQHAMPAQFFDISTLKAVTGDARRIWLDIDCDVFDPSCFPATHQPLPCGLTGLQVLHAIEAIGIDRLAGASICEYDPSRDHDDASLSLIGWLMEWLLLRRIGA